MIISGVVERIDVTQPGFRTLSGAQVGDSEARVQRLYGGRLEVTPHHYDESGHYLTLYSGDKKWALVFETDGKHVISYRIGRLPAAGFVEGCS